MTLRLFDLAGREVGTLLRAHELAAGPHQMTCDVQRLKSGIYLYRLETRDFSATRKMIVLR